MNLLDVLRYFRRSGKNALVLFACGLAALTAPELAFTAPADPPAAVVKLTARKNAITIDGKGTEPAWVHNTAVNSVSGTAGVVATYKLAYDAANFYALITVNDSTPLKANAAADLRQLFKFADAIGFCFGPVQGQSHNQRIFFTQTAGQPHALVMRPSWPDKSHAHTYTMNTSVTLDDVHELAAPTDYEAAFTSTASSYTLEVRLPWTTIGYVPVDGQEFPFDLQVVFSSNGTANEAVAWWHGLGPEPFTITDLPTEAALYPQYWGYAHWYATDPGPQPVPPVPGDEEDVFANPGPGSVPIRFAVTVEKPYASLVIKDANGWIVRELLRVRKLAPNVTQTVYWDGRDRTGQPCAPGHYTYLLGTFKGLTVEFAGSVGNSGHPVYTQADGSGSIGGVHGGPWNVAADSTGIYLLSAIAEGQPPYRKYSPTTGATLWWATYGHYPYAVAVSSNELFLINSDTGAGPVQLLRLNRDTGAVVADRVKMCGRSLSAVKVDGLAVLDDVAYYTEPLSNRIMRVDLSHQTNAPTALVTFPSAPHGLAAYDASSFLVCVANKIVKVTTTGGQTDLIATGLVAPYAVAVDAARGWVYVSDPGTTNQPVHQILKYNLAGVHQATWGVPGGRPLEMARVDPLKLLNVMGLAVDPNNGDVWAAERWTDLRRFVRWRNDGVILEQSYGPTPCSPSIIVDRDDTSNVYYHSMLDTFVQAKVNFAQYAADFQHYPNPPAGWGTTQAWSVVSTWNPGGTNSVEPALQGKFYFLGQPRGDGTKIEWGSCSPGQVLTATNGHRYLMITDLFLSVHAAIMLWENNRWTPVTTVGQSAGAPIWADTVTPNGRVESNEFATATSPGGGFVWLDTELTLHGRAGTLKPASINARGVPIYAGGQYTSLLNPAEPPLASYYEYYYDVPGYPSRVDADGAQYIVGQVGPGGGLGVWDRATETRVLKLKDGRVEWIIGHHNGAMTHNGDNLLLGRPAGAGVIDGVLLCPEAICNFTAYTTDGLTLGWVARDANDHGATAGPTALLVENFNGFFVKDPVTGKRLLITGTTEDVRLLELKDVFTLPDGTSDLTRTTGNLTLASALPRVVDEVVGQYAQRYRTWPLQWAQFATVTGYDWDFAKDVDALGIQDGTARVADLRLRRDAGQLCVFADVLDPSVFPDAPRDPAQNYEHGDGIEILLGPLNPTRTLPTAGDTRLFLTAKRNASSNLVGYAYACRPASPDISATYLPDLRALLHTGAFTGTAPAAPLSFRAGLVAIPGAVVTVKPRFDRAGYRLEAEIPLALFPELVGTNKTTVSIFRSLARPAATYTDARWDLPESPLRFNAAVFLGGRRLPWVPDDQVAGNPLAMNPSRWGIANSKVTIDWPAIGGTCVNGHSRYNLYRSASRDPLTATWVGTVTDALQLVDAPGAGYFQYWLAPLYNTGEGQWIGPVATDANRLVHFWRPDPAPVIPATSLTNVVGYVGTTAMLNVRLPSGSRPKCVAPAGLSVTPHHWRSAQGDEIWSLAIALPANTPVGSTATAHLTAGRVSRDLVVTAALAPLQSLELGPLAGQSPWSFVITNDPLKWTPPSPNYAAYGLVEAEPGQPGPCIHLHGGDCRAQFPITAIPETRVERWRLTGKIKYNYQYCGGQPTRIQVLDDAGQAIVTFAHDLLRYRDDLYQALLLNGVMGYDSNGYANALLGNWQAFTLTVADGQARLQYAGAYEATAPAPASWRRPRILVIDVENHSGSTSHPDRQILVNDLKLVITPASAP